MGCGTVNRTKVEEPLNVRSSREYAEDERIMYDEDIEKEMKNKSSKGKSKAVEKVTTEEKVGFFYVEKPGEGDQMLAIKPWLGALKPPVNPPKIDNSPPAYSLDLEYVYGYRCFDSRQNLFYARNPDEVVYMTAAIGVVLNKRTNTQKIFGAGLSSSTTGHTDDITSLAIHPDRDTIATGEVGKNPKICIWKASNPSNSLVDFRQGRDSRAVSCLGFSYDGRYLASGDLHNDHNVRVWEWQKSLLIQTLKGGPDRIFDLCWSPKTYIFCTAGVKHMAFWELNSNVLAKKNGIFGNSGNMCNMTSIAWLGDFCLTGGTNGQVYKWTGNQCSKTFQVHPLGSAIHSISVVGGKILTGGKDNTIKVCDGNFKELKSIQLNSFPRALDMINDTILAGNRDGTILEVNSAGNQSILMQSHSDGEVWGLCIDPKNSNLMMSVGDDNYLKVWDIVDRRCVGSKMLESVAGPQRKAGQGASTMASNSPNQQARAICACPVSEHLAIGHNDGHVSIIQDTRTLNIVKTLRDPKEWIESISYSPDGKMLAVGSHDNMVYLYKVPEYILQHKLQGHSSFIIALDWSVDSAYLHSNCGAYELLFWDANNGKQIKSGATMLRDEVWDTWTAKLGWPVQGIYEGIIDMTHVNTVDRSKNQKFVAVGNDWGNVVIFNYPNGEGAKSKDYKGHSEHVTNVKWNADDEYLISVGGYDQTIMQWKVIK